MDIDRSFWHGRRVFVTGHTGFKGSWLCLWLHRLGARVTGFALPPPTDPGLFAEARVADAVAHHAGDIREYSALKAVMDAADPEVVFHLAAQPLVRESYARPLETYQTNVLGTAHVLEAARSLKHVRSVVVVTTDKCYENHELGRPFVENDPLGGHDPYSASKACSEIVAASYRDSFFAGEGAAGIATARAGNVIGGGDFAADRIVPDILRAWQAGEAVVLRNAGAVRPWQEVLEPLGGYMLLAQRLWADPAGYSEAFNFGPDPEDCREVGELADMLCTRLGVRWRHDASVQPREAGFLRLDSRKAAEKLGWRPVFRLEETVDFIARFAGAMRDGKDVRELCMERIGEYAQ